MSADAHHEDEYDDALIALLELVWGEGFLSPGGPEAVAGILAGLDVVDRRVLDVGCGIGGIDVLLARDYGARVIGLDVERGVVERARRRIEAEGLADRVEIRLYEPGKLPLEDASVDVVFGKDSWIHIADKRAFFAEVLRVLAPGGLLAAGDWLRGPEPYSEQMRYFFELEGLTYHMDTLENYGAILEQVGFADVALTDISAEYRAQARREYEQMLGPLAATMRETLGEDRAGRFVENWRMLTVVLDAGELRPGRMRARKPA